MSDQELLLEKKNGVALITMNRPEKLNAITVSMMQQGVDMLQELVHDKSVGAIVLTGAGRGFCAGGDVGNMQASQNSNEPEPTLEEGINHQKLGHRFPAMLHHHAKPVIAALNGATAGAGLGIALACDVRIASDKARFTTAFANVGFGGDYGVTWGLTHSVGPAKAKELFFLTDPIGAEEAERIGLVNRVVAHDDLMGKAMEVAERIAAGPAVSYRYMKANVNFAMGVDYQTMLDREAETHQRCGRTEDHKEGVKAFLEKRPPVFQGR